ncbi:MAG: prepilin-type N-terminal cleavage/methylation domain-containing protein [Planctomycetota bacterium]
MRTRAFTLIELLVVISIIALLIAILLPALGAARQSARQLQSTTHLRGLHQGLVIYANENKTYFPGLESNGARFITAANNFSNTSGAMVQGRFALILEYDLVTPDYLINPGEPSSRTAYDLGSGDTFGTDNYSYAMLNIAGDQNDSGYTGLPNVNPNKGRHTIKEWRDTMNSQAVMMGDRLLEVLNNDFTNPDAYLGTWSKDYGDSKWGVVWNDNHTELANTPFFETKYSNITNSNDDIFTRGNPAQHGNVQTGGATDAQSPGNCFLAARNAVDIAAP